MVFRPTMILNMSSQFADGHDICTKKGEYEWEENEYELLVCFAIVHTLLSRSFRQDTSFLGLET